MRSIVHCIKKRHGVFFKYIKYMYIFVFLITDYLSGPVQQQKIFHLTFIFHCFHLWFCVLFSCISALDRYTMRTHEVLGNYRSLTCVELERFLIRIRRWSINFFQMNIIFHGDSRLWQFKHVSLSGEVNKS